MIYVKSLLAGVAALLVASVLFCVVGAFWIIRNAKVPPGTTVGWDIRVLNRPLFWLIPILAFAIGFYWEFRRASRWP